MTIDSDNLSSEAGLVRDHPMVDEILSYRSAPTPELTSRYQVSATHRVFDGHFPERPVWPGVHTLEGLQQSCALWYRLRRKEAETCEPAAAAVAPSRAGPDALNCRMRVKFVRPVYPGSVIDYHVRADAPNPMSWHVVARVENKDVAKGEITWAE